MMYIVTAYRWGERDNHSYNVGVFTTLELAKGCADSHTAYRGGKYGCLVEEATPDGFHNDMPDYTKEVYRTNSLRN